MVSGNMTPKTQSQMSGREEPRPIVYVGGPLAGQKRADDGQARRVLDVGGVQEVYYRTVLSIKKGSLAIDFYVMAYHGPVIHEVKPLTWKRREERKAGDEKPDNDCVGGAA